jgi:phosphatidylglycerophosphate synthase
MNNSETAPNTLIILAGNSQPGTGFVPSLSRVATLPLVLRIALTAQKLNVNRIILSVASEAGSQYRKSLQQTGRLPAWVEWYESAEPSDLVEVSRRVPEGNLIIVSGDRSYQPSLLSKAAGWKPDGDALFFCDGKELIGICVLGRRAVESLAQHEGSIASMEHLAAWLSMNFQLEYEEVSDGSWQKVSRLSDLEIAEKKLDQWLLKPTDGLFARMNRRVSIPISRSIVHLPITPNMVTFFTLWVSFGAGLFFAHGGYWATLFGAFLSVAASILDGCDGEVARLKLQVTDFGCWLETVCDYLYYVFVFGGMIIGFSRSMGTKFALTWGAMLIFGAIASFLSVGFARHHFAAGRPEAFLSIWQGKAERRRSNPLLFLGRYTEFIIRRCFLPYAFLGFALLNILPVAFVWAAIGSNIVWPIALYSCFTLTSRRVRARTGVAAN